MVQKIIIIFVTRKLENVSVRQIFVDLNVTNVAQVIMAFPTAKVSLHFFGNHFMIALFRNKKLMFDVTLQNMAT